MALENVSLEEMESLATLSKTLSDNPATRRRFLELIKEASPMTNIPEIDLETRLNHQSRPLQDKIEALERQLQEQNFKDLREKSHKKLKDMGIPDDKIPEVEQMMLNKKIGDYEVAGEHYLSSQRSAEPTAASFRTPMSIPKAEGVGTDLGSWKSWANQQAHEAVNDIIRARK